MTTKQSRYDSTNSQNSLELYLFLYLMIFLSPLIFLCLECSLPFLSWPSAATDLSSPHHHNYAFSLLFQGILHVSLLKHFLYDMTATFFFCFIFNMSESLVRLLVSWRKNSCPLHLWSLYQPSVGYIGSAQYKVVEVT